MPEFDSAMSLLEVREFIEASIAQAGFSNVEGLKFQPATFAGRDGFRFEFTFTNADGLRSLAVASGAKVDDKFYMVMYRGAKLHYYEKYLKNVEDMIQSIELALALSFV